MTDVISRAVAKSLGLTYYFTGKPCRAGHVALRLTKCTACVECKKARNAAYFASNIEARRASMSAYNSANRQRINAAMRDRYQADPAASVEKLAKRRAAMQASRPAWFGEFDELVLSEAADLAVTRSRLTGIRWEVDHAVPLRCRQACGLHVGLNVQVIPARLNRAKGNRLMLLTPAEWLAALAAGSPGDTDSSTASRSPAR